MFVKRKHINLLSVFLLLVFAGAFTVSALCDLEIIAYAANLTHQHDKELDHQQNHHHGELAHHGSHHQDNTHQHDSDEEACCEEIANSLESGLFYSHVTISAPTVKLYLLKTIDFTSKSILFYKQTNIIYYEYDDPPPLEGFSLRVVIQSFLN